MEESNTKRNSEQAGENSTAAVLNIEVDDVVDSSKAEEKSYMSYLFTAIELYRRYTFPSISNFDEKDLEKFHLSWVILIVFQSAFLAIILASFVSAYISATTKPYLAPNVPSIVIDKYCKTQPVSVTGYYYLDSGGNWDTSPNFVTGGAIYFLKAEGMQVNQAQYSTMMNYFANQMKTAAATASKRDVFWTYVAFSSLHYRYDVPGGNGVVYFGLYGDTSQIFSPSTSTLETVAFANMAGDGITTCTTSSCAQNGCNFVDSTPTGWSTTSTGTYVSSTIPLSGSDYSYSLPSQCSNAFSLQDFSNSKTSSSADFTFTFDLRSLTTALMINYQLSNSDTFPLKLVADFPQWFLTENSNEWQFLEDFGYYIDPYYPGMQPVVCNPTASSTTSLCLVNIGTGYIFPFISNQGYYNKAACFYNSYQTCSLNGYSESTNTNSWQSCSQTKFDSFLGSAYIGLLYLSFADAKNYQDSADISNALINMAKQLVTYSTTSPNTDQTLTNLAFNAMSTIANAIYNPLADPSTPTGCTGSGEPTSFVGAVTNAMTALCATAGGYKSST